MVGLKSSAPFRGPTGVMCNHLFPIAAPIPDPLHWKAFLNLHQDLLVQAMLPIPRGPEHRGFFVEDPHDDLSLYLQTLSRMSSPLTSVAKPAWMVKDTEIEKQMKATNVQPWVITQLDQKKIDLMNTIAKALPYTPRVVILTGKGELPVPKGFHRIKSNIRETPLEDLVRLPFENIGMMVLRRYVRKEELFGEIESRQKRRDRIISERKKDQ